MYVLNLNLPQCNVWFFNHSAPQLIALPSIEHIWLYFTQCFATCAHLLLIIGFRTGKTQLTMKTAISRPEVPQLPSMPSDATLLMPKPLLLKSPPFSNKESVVSKKSQVSLKPVESFLSGMAMILTTKLLSDLFFTNNVEVTVSLVSMA
jgi:hypothetical protein